MYTQTRMKHTQTPHTQTHVQAAIFSHEHTHIHARTHTQIHTYTHTLHAHNMHFMTKRTIHILKTTAGSFINKDVYISQTVIHAPMHVQTNTHFIRTYTCARTYARTHVRT